MTAVDRATLPALRRPPGWLVLAVLLGLTLAAALAALCFGASGISPSRVLAVLLDRPAADPATSARDSMIVLAIRLPRLLLGLSVGAALAVSGAVMQGLFRNPLADPGLIGVSSGASLAAAVAIVLGDKLLAGGPGNTVPFAYVPPAAFFGALAATFTLYAIARREGSTSIAVMLLAGVALAAVSGAGTGWMAFLSDDRQLRDLTFWSLGSLGGATWTKVMAVVPMIAAALAFTPFLARGLNAMALGESEAYHLGIDLQRLKTVAITLVSVSVGAAVAASGLIGFVGIVVPHALRLIVGPDYRLLLPASALLGAAFLTFADVCARTIVAPAEIPIGILTATVGGPFFLWLLLRRKQELGL